MAWFRRHPGPGLIFHADRQPILQPFDAIAVLASYDMLSSMSRKGNCRDNGLTESLWGA